MKLSAELNQKIIDFFTSLPNMQNRNAWEALINSASLDEQLQTNIDFSGPAGQFFQHLVSTLLKYGMLADDRHALIAALEATQTLVGKDRQTVCRALINEVSVLLQNETQQNIDNKHARRQKSSRLPKRERSLSEIAELKRLEMRKQEREQAYQMVGGNIQALNEDYHNAPDQFNKSLIQRKLDKQLAERDKIEQELQRIEAEIERLHS